MEFHRQLIHQQHLQSHLHYGNDPTVAKHNGIPSATPPPAPLVMPFALRERSYSCKSQWNSVGRTCTKKLLKPHLHCGTDPTMIRPHTRPSRNRRTAEVDHRGSGTDFVWKNIGFRTSAISQKRISCETSFKTPPATPPPAPLAMPFALRERSYSCESQWNSIGNSSTSTTCNPIYIAGTILQLQITMEFCRPHMHIKIVETPFTMRNRSDHDPTTHETVSQPSHRRGRSSRFGDGLCMEKHRVSCICYLSKTHFVRDFLQNSIGNSSTNTTCNAICIAGTNLQLQITMEFHRQLIHQHHLQSHLHCGNDPTVANHNGILSTAHARKTVETPFTMRNRSDHDPTMSRPHTRPSRNRRTAEIDHRGSGTDFVWKNIGFRASAIFQNRISCETSFKIPSATPPPAPLAMPFALRERSYSCKAQWYSIGNSSTSTTCNPIYIAGTILQLQITMEFCRPHMHEKQLKPHLQCGTDPTMIRPHTRPSRNRRTAEVDHRGSGTDFVWKNIGFRVSAISQKRISCETSFKTPSATPPPAPLAMPFALRERSYSCKSQWNSIGNSSTSTTCNPICIAGTILQLQITMALFPSLTLPLTNSFPDNLKVTINSFPN